MKKVIVAKLNIKKAFKDQFLELAEKLITNTRKEEGCLSYNLYQNSFSEDPEFMFYEEYKNEEAINIHSSSDYLVNFFKNVKPLLSSEAVINKF